MGRGNTNAVSAAKMSMSVKDQNMKKLRPPVKTHGGKYYLSNWVIEHFPQDYKSLTYCELCCGGGSVFLNKERSGQEVINDLDRGIVSIFKALRDEPKEFIDKVKRIKYTERTFQNAQRRAEEPIEDYIDLAVNEFVLRRMSRGGMKKAFAWSERLRGGKPGDVNAWDTMLKQLSVIAERLKGVIILNGHFREPLKVWDEESVMLYLDPPYLPATRSKGATDVYDNEMSVEDHIELLTHIKGSRCKVLLSGYASPLYNKHLKDWKCIKKEIANHASQQKVKERRFECLWINY